MPPPFPLPGNPFLRRIIGGPGAVPPPDPCAKVLGSQQLGSVCGSLSKIVWYDASQETYADGTRMGTLHDFSGNAQNLTQAVAAQQAVFQVGSAPAGGPTFGFDTNSEGYGNAAGAGIAQAGITVHAVVRYALGQTNPGPAINTQVFNWNDVNGFGLNQIFGDGYSGNFNDVVSFNGAGLATACMSAICGWQVLSLTWTAAGVMTLYRQGSVVCAAGNIGLNPANPTQFFVGAASFFVGNGLIMQLSELMMLAGAETAAQVLTDTNCLIKKWGLPSLSGASPAGCVSPCPVPV